MFPEFSDSIALFSAVIGLLLAAAGLFFNGLQLRMSRQIAKGGFVLQFDEMLAQFSDIDQRLKYGRKGYGPLEPLTDEEWYRVHRYFGRLESLFMLAEDGIVDVDLIDRAYSHRIIALSMNPEVKQKKLIDGAIPNRDFVELLHLLEKKPIFQLLAQRYEDQWLRSEPLP